MLFTGEIESEFVSKHEFGNEWLPSTSDPYFEFTIAKFSSVTSTGRDFDSMYSESFSFASTGKCNSMVELFASTGRVLTYRSLQSFLSTQRANVTRWLNYLPQRAEILSHRSNSTPPRAKNTVNDFPAVAPKSLSLST